MVTGSHYDVSEQDVSAEDVLSTPRVAGPAQLCVPEIVQSVAKMRGEMDTHSDECDV